MRATLKNENECDLFKSGRWGVIKYRASVAKFIENADSGSTA